MSAPARWLCLVALLLAAGADESRPWAAPTDEDPLGNVREGLQKLAGTSPIKAALERAVTAERKDRPLEAGRVNLDVQAGPAGISLQYPAALLAEIRAEKALTDPEKAKPTTRTLEGFDAIDVAALLNGATGLLSDLEGATIKGDSIVDYQGKPARLLDLDLVVRTSKANSKWLKSASSTMRLWLGPDGLPLAAESEFTFRAGLLIFNYDGKDVETHTYSRVGDRLVAVRYTTRFDGDGLGESQHFWSETTLRLQAGS